MRKILARAPAPLTPYSCFRCNHAWQSPLPYKPDKCAHCRSRYWDVETLSPETQARVTGICMEDGCTARVQGMKGLARRCAEHKATVARKAKAESRRRVAGRAPQPVPAPAAVAPRMVAPPSPHALTPDELAREREASLARQRREFEHAMERGRERGVHVTADPQFRGNRTQRRLELARSA